MAGGQPDFKECYFAAPIEVDPRARRYYPEVYADNVWPEGQGAFRERYLALGRAVHAVGLTILTLCEQALELDTGTLTHVVDGGAHVSRALRYLPVTETQVDQGVLWGEEHTDFNVLTLLPGGQFFDPDGTPCAPPDDGSGLYLRTRPTTEHPDGELVRGTAPAGHMVAQVGQQLEILTGGELLATPHIIRPPRSPGTTRTSFAHFIHANALQTLRPVPEFTTDTSVARYGPPVLAGTYAMKTLIDIGLVPPDVLEKLGYRHYGRLAAIRRRESGE